MRMTDNISLDGDGAIF